MLNEAITITVGEDDKDNSVEMKLVARQTMDGNIIVSDHTEIDVMIQPNDKRIVAFPKEIIDDSVYSTQDRLFSFLADHGVIKRDTVEAGDVYGSIQAEYPEAANGANTTQLVLLNVGKWIEEERPWMETEQYFEEEGEERLTEPSDEDSTDLGDVPHESEKGTIAPNKIRRVLSGYGYY